MERSLRRRGFAAIAGADEAGRGACAGPLVAAACVLPAGRRGRVPGLADSKLLTAATRDEVYAEVVDRALAWSVVTIPVADLDARGMHVTNLEALRRAVLNLDPAPDYVLTDGFPVPGLARPGLAVWKGDRVAACVAAASVLAKVTRDRMMLELHERWPAGRTQAAATSGPARAPRPASSAPATTENPRRRSERSMSQRASGRSSAARV